MRVNTMFLRYRMLAGGLGLVLSAIAAGPGVGAAEAPNPGHDLLDPSRTE